MGEKKAGMPVKRVREVCRAEGMGAQRACCDIRSQLISQYSCQISLEHLRIKGFLSGLNDGQAKVQISNPGDPKLKIRS
jgi:hypothetical protein